ncbi:Uncharacterized protein DAT39_009141, partial [Clarias magur]
VKSDESPLLRCLQDACCSTSPSVRVRRSCEVVVDYLKQSVSSAVPSSHGWRESTVAVDESRQQIVCDQQIMFFVPGRL